MKMELRESEARALVSFAYDPFGRDLPADSAHGIIRHRDFLNS